MSIPLSWWMWLLAATPIIILLILMIGFGLGAKKAAPIGLLMAVFNSVVFYQADMRLISYELGKGLWSAMIVLIVVFPAIMLYEVVVEAKAFSVFRIGLQKASPNELIQILAIGWVFTSFLQGITGFGVPTAVGAPLLIGIGVAPMWAVFIPLIGHAWANTFGTLAVAWDALVLQTGIASSPDILLATALWASIFIWIWNAMTGLIIAWVYGGKKAVQMGFQAIMLISLIHGGGQLLLSQVNATIAAFVPAVVALFAILWMSRWKRYKEQFQYVESPVMKRQATEVKSSTQNMTFFDASFPYIVLTVITLIILLVNPLKVWLSSWQLALSFPQTVTGYGFMNGAIERYSPFALFTHAGFFLLVSALMGFTYFVVKHHIRLDSGLYILGRSVRKTIPSGIAVIGFVLMSRVMGGTGQTVILARGIASIVQSNYSLLAPLVGMLGSFMTSSNMASNILFAEFQMTTANLLQLDVASILGAQTAGGAIGGTISPGNIILGTTTAGILGKEGEILKKILPYAISASVVIGIIVFISLLN